MKLVETRYIVAVDGGGSTCRVSIADQHGNVLGSAKGPPANLYTDFENSRASIIETVRKAYQAASLPEDRSAEDYAYLGLAGASIGDIASRLEASLGFFKCKVSTDRETTVQGALGSDDGTVVLLGTGSFFVSRRDGVTRNIGGWGFRLCDDGGGAFLGLALLRQVILAFDGRIEHSNLTRSILAKFGGTPHQIIEFAQNASPKEFGEYAPRIVQAFEDRDEVAVSLIEGATARIEHTLRILGATYTDTICMMGGLGPFYQSQLSDTYQKLCKPPIGDAMAGAISLARQQLVGGDNEHR